jgi:LysM repeat protein
MGIGWKGIHARHLLQKKDKSMNDGKSTRSVIDRYRKRRQQNRAFIVWGGATLLILVGIILLVIWLTGPSKPLSGLLATETPTPTLTFTPTATSIPTETPTITATFTETPTATKSAPYTYVVQEGDFLATIVEKENLGPDGIALILLLNPYDETTGNGIDPATQIVYPGQEILLPYPGMPLPTATPIPPDLSRGTILTYTIQAGDTLAGIAALFNSTVDDIIAENDLEDPNAIFVGQQLDIPVNLVTPTATFPPTSTPLTPVAETPSATATP